MMDKQALASKIEAARIAYYNGTPTLSDAAYDALEDQLRAADPDHWVLKVVGAPPGDSGWPKVKHSVPMGSLNKAQVYQEMVKWQKGLETLQDYNRALAVNPTVTPELLLTEKLDGISCSIRYFDGKFAHGTTRGDGITGEDITRNVSLMEGVPPTLQGDFALWSGHLRGEIVCRKSMHAEHFPGESNPRNSASGTAKRQSNPEKCQYLTVMVYQVLPDDGQLPTKLTELQLAKEMGFQTPHHAMCPDLTRVENIYQRYIKMAREKLDYDIDGLVVEVNSSADSEELGMLNGRPKGAIAYKFPHSSAITTLEDVVWQVGNSGRITPVAIFEQVELDGAKIVRASLSTAKRFLELNLRKGGRIRVSRRNMVIPYVEESLDA